MNIRDWLIDFVVTFAVTLVVVTVVTYLWNLIGHGAGAFEWETSFRFAVILGIVLPWMKARERKKKEK